MFKKVILCTIAIIALVLMCNYGKRFVNDALNKGFKPVYDAMNPQN